METRDEFTQFDFLDLYPFIGCAKSKDYLAGHYLKSQFFGSAIHYGRVLSNC
jgi:hypothetical protein